MTRLLLSKSSQKFVKKLKDKNLKNKIKDGLDKIRTDYTVGEKKTGDLKGFWSLDIFYNKTNYEICYEVREEDGLIVIVVMIGTRENFYKELKRYIDNWFLRDSERGLLYYVEIFIDSQIADSCQREGVKRTSICRICRSWFNIGFVVINFYRLISF